MYDASGTVIGGDIITPESRCRSLHHYRNESLLVVISIYCSLSVGRSLGSGLIRSADRDVYNVSNLCSIKVMRQQNM